MAKQERQLLANWDSSAAYWQYRCNPAGYERKQPHKQANQNTDDTEIILLCILGTIGFLAALAGMILWSIL
jgi:hypothetical protein